MQPSGSPIMDQIHQFHNLLLVIITCITLFVLGLLVTVMVKFNARANPVPSRTTLGAAPVPGWVVPSMTTGRVIAGKADSGAIVFVPVRRFAAPVESTTALTRALY